MNQIDDMGWVHGIRVTFYSDWKTIYSKTTLDHGIKNGPYIRYYKSRQIFKPGNTINKKIEIIAEIPTTLGNIMVNNLSYDLQVSNSH